MAKVSVVKLFDTRRPLALSNRGRRSCLCILPSPSALAPPPPEQYCESENSSSKENNFNENADEVLKIPCDDVIDDGNKCCVTEELQKVPSLSSIIESTSNSLSCNCEEGSDISSVESTSNSSWNNVSKVSLVESFNESKYVLFKHINERKYSSQENSDKQKCILTESSNSDQHALTDSSVEPKYVHNKFPTVFSKREATPNHMNMCSEGDDVVIPIRFARNNSKQSSKVGKHHITTISENSTDYDIDSDRLNTSLVEVKRPTMDKTNLSSSSQKYSHKHNNKSKKVLDNTSKSVEVVLNVYISDIRGIEDSLILNKDRRFCRIMERYKCCATILQMNNMSRGFPHTLLKITGASKMQLQCMSRDADRIHPQWNLRSQLRSVHA